MRELLADLCVSRTDGRFWSGEEHEFTSPIEPDTGARTADLPIAELDLAVEQTLAFAFDFGDEWQSAARTISS